MAKSPFAKRDEQFEIGRRALIKWSVAAGAALGVSRSKIFDIIEKTSGKSTVAAASDSVVRRAFCVNQGNGGLAWMTQLFPFPDIARSTNAQISYRMVGQGQVMPGTKNLYVTGPDTPFAAMPAARQMTCFLAGQNETHQGASITNNNLAGNNINAVMAALQANAPSVIPVVTIGNQFDYGTAPGAPRAANVGNGEGIVGLFNSAASRQGGLLAQQRDAELYKAHYDAFTQLNRAAGLSTTKAGYTTASGAAGLLGTNLAARLAIQPADLTRYGINGGTPGNVAALGRSMIVAVKSMAAGLTNMVGAQGPSDDPHGAFDGGGINTTVPALKRIWDAFMTDLDNTIDEVTLKPLSADIVITVSGDTFKSPTNRAGWGDGTPGNTNALYVYSSGDLYSGWFGNISAAGQVTGWGPDGKPAAYNAAMTSRYALAAVAYAVAKRDTRLISQFANGIEIGGTLGNPKDQ